MDNQIFFAMGLTGALRVARVELRYNRVRGCRGNQNFNAWEQEPMKIGPALGLNHKRGQ